MDSRFAALQQEMDHLRAELSCDFCTVGVVEGESRTLRWKQASGNSNDRYKQIADRPGRGLTGTVVKVGRPMQLNVADLVNARQVHEYPILLAENLRSAFAVPLMDGPRVAGVLLVGDRKRRVYRAEERTQAAQAGLRMSVLFGERAAETGGGGNDNRPTDAENML